MNENQSTYLRRDCAAVQIPIGNTVTLPAGTEVYLVQTLGGSHTVRALDGLFRIGPRDSDALGLEPAAPPAESSTPAAEAGKSGLEAEAWAALKTCYDPEIPVNIVDLGLVYDLAVAPHESGSGSLIGVKMTLTAPGCGMGPTIARDAQEKLLMLPGVIDADVQIVWDPPWHQSMITPEGRQALGLG